MAYKLGQEYRFKCGHKGILPNKYGENNEFAYWVKSYDKSSSHGGFWYCERCFKNAGHEHKKPKTQPGEWKCRKCRRFLTKDNACRTAVKKGGLCIECGPGPMNYQKLGQMHTFKACGHIGRLPRKRKMKNNFADWGGDGWQCHQCNLVRQREKSRILKLEVFSALCGGTPYCQCPGCRNGKENPVHMSALQLDHKEGTGAKHFNKRGYRMTGRAVYHWVKANGYPKDFQVLCANCNNPSAKGNRDKCPMHGEPH